VKGELQMSRSATARITGELLVISAKVRALGHLIESQSSETIPLDIEEINYGIGSLLIDEGEKLRRLYEDLDLEQVRRAQLKKKKD
jgi:hypothetical protein